MLWNYTILILCVLLVVRFVQMKRSIRKGNYDYRYYEDGPYGEKKRKKTVWGQIKAFFNK
jgi:hypothetical protein